MPASKAAPRTTPSRANKSKPGPQAPAPLFTPATRDFALGLALLFATFIAYLPALRGDLIWDDNSHVTKPELQSLHGLWRIWFDLGATQQYYPLLHSAFWMEHRLWGDAVLGYHLTNTALHALSACLLVFIVRRLSLPGAWLAGFLFALHPVCVEAVAWITEQKSTLSGVFYLAATLAYLRFDGTRRRSLYFMASGLFILALMSKTVTATLPAALLVVLWWKRGKVEAKRDVLALAPWLAIGASAGLFTAWVERTYIGAQGAQFNLSFLDWLLLGGRVICFYLAKLVWPANLIFIYPRWSIDAKQWWQYLFSVAVVALAVVLIALARRHRGPLAAFLYFSGTLFPVLGFFNVYPFLFSYVADHFQYLASIGLLVPAAYWIATAAGGRALPVAGPALVIVLGILTFRQSSMYTNAETLYRETIARNPGCWMAYNNLGNIDSKIPGRRDAAIAEYEAALRLKPDYAEAHYNVANLLVPARLSEALAHYREALRINPDLADVHTNYATALALSADRLPEAIAEYQKSLELKPGVAATHFNLGNALAKLPEGLARAIEQYRIAIKLQPDFAEAHYNLALALSKNPANYPEATVECETALRIKPGLEPARRVLEQLRAIQSRH